MVHTWHILQYLAYTAIPGIYRNTWHISQYLAYTAIPGIYRNTWIACYTGLSEAEILQISFTAEIYRFHLQQNFTNFCDGILQISSAARFYRFHLRQKFTDFICSRNLQISSATGFYRFHLRRDFKFQDGRISAVYRTHEKLWITERQDARTGTDCEI